MQTDWTKPERTLENLFAQHGGLLTRKQVEQAGLEPYLLTRWVRHGKAERLQRGVYRAIAAPAQSHEGLLEVQLRIPYAVACLATALAFHGLTTFIPKSIQVAVPRERKPPKLSYPPLEVFYFSPAQYEYGLEHHPLGKHQLKVYSPEKTLADLLRYRNQLGEDLFIEGLRNYLKRRNPRPDLSKLLQAAKICRVEKQLRPLLEVLLYEPTV